MGVGERRVIGVHGEEGATGGGVTIAGWMTSAFVGAINCSEGTMDCAFDG